MKIIYTVITDNYDTLKEPQHNNPSWEFICFTDSPTLKSDRWRVVLLDNPHGLSNHLLSREPKILFHKYLPEGCLSLYIDASYGVVGDLDEFIETPMSDISLVIRDLNRSVNDELVDLEKYKTTKKGEADKLIEKWGDKIDSRGTYYYGGLILRRDTPAVRKIMDEWWEDILNVFKRDQPTLQLLLKKHNIRPGEYSTRQVRQYFTFHFHKQSTILSSEEPDPTIYYFTPADPTKKIGKVYNAHCESVPNNEDWICIRDGDTMFLTSNWSHIIKETIKRYPDTALFGCYTNRIGLDYQLADGFSENPDVTYHARKAQEQWEKYGTECVEIDKPVAGMFMLFRRSVWTRVPFKDDLVVGNKFFDWDFGERVLKLGGKVRLMKGVYLFHFYRFLTGRQDKSHLL